MKGHPYFSIIKLFPMVYYLLLLVLSFSREFLLLCIVSGLFWQFLFIFHYSLENQLV